ncbi:FAD-linked oxidase C-terminal domain-containing protein [Streptomyces sp. NPDC013187]|uniref:FAD-linked oxidase C-terminal domain-containing protein n=1 Tax=Streptomyces sp. NPDC013187 TaxID=3364865 RepID=UPI0036B69199
MTCTPRCCHCSGRHWPGRWADRPRASRPCRSATVAPALRLGGTLTGEYGVGVLERQRVAGELGPTAHAVQRRIKEALDPRGILNPRKAL